MDLRKNVIVMGDIVEDSQMVRDANHETVLRVGFLNRQVQEEIDEGALEIEKFRQAFDIIVGGDGSLCPVLGALEAIFKDQS